MAAADRHGADGPVLAGLTSVHRDDAESTRGLRHGEISLSLRIGISGHRNIAPDHPGLTGEIAKALEYITQKLAASVQQPTSRAISLTAVSSLAEGADRVVANEVLKRQGARLEVILPVPADDYCADFTSPVSVDEFRELLSRDAAPDLLRTARSREQAYELAGRAVVDRSDVMIIVWDGKPARGQGGTAEIYAYARRWQKPVLLIRTDDHSARLDTGQLPRGAEGTMPLTAENMKRLDQYNRERLSSRVFARSAPLLAQTDARPWLASAAPLIEYISRYFTRADLLAERLQKRWMWVNRSLYILAPLAVLTVAAQIEFAPSHERYAWIEFGILALLTVLNVTARRAGWHARWVSARYLAEQLRSMMFLGLTGMLTPEKSSSSAVYQAVSEAGWTERAANEVWFSRPRYDPPADITLLINVLYEEWIKHQLHYHRSTSEAHQQRSSRLQVASVALFTVSAVAALLHSLGAGSSPARPFKWWDFLAIAIPAVAGALSGYGAQRDYVRHAERSRAFAAALDHALDRLLGARNLRDIQQAALSISRSMRDEATDWYSVVHSQDVELPT